MFAHLKDLVGNDGVVVLTVAGIGDGRLRVSVVPKADAATPALSQPLQLEATADELDAGFAEAVSSYRVARKSLSEQVADTVAILEAAKDAKKAEASKAIARTTPSAGAAKNTKVAGKAEVKGGTTEPAADDKKAQGGGAVEPPQAAPSQSASIDLFSAA